MAAFPGKKSSIHGDSDEEDPVQRAEVSAKTKKVRDVQDELKNVFGIPLTYINTCIYACVIVSWIGSFCLSIR